MIGSPTASSEINTAQTPQDRNQPAPSCCRNSFAETGPSTRGHATSRRQNQTSNNSGASIIGKLICNAAKELKVVLKSTQTSAGNTFTCRIAGTAKLFNASTKVSTAA